MNKEILRLIAYALSNRLISKEDVYYTINQLLSILHLDEFKETTIPLEMLESPEPILLNMIQDMVDREVIQDTPKSRKRAFQRLLHCILPKPSMLSASFYELKEDSSKKATDYYYRYARSSLMIDSKPLKRTAVQTNYGQFDIVMDSNKRSLDYSKDYPKCPLCKENEGYQHQFNHRYIPISFDKETYHFEFINQAYMPQQFYLSHEKHVSCLMDRKTFEHLLDFVHQYPHYFITCETPWKETYDHAHYMGAGFITRLEKTRIESYYTLKDYEDVEVGKLFYPTTVLRLRSKVRRRLVDLADKIYLTWKEYSDPSISLLAYDDKESHHSLQVIARKIDDYYELDLVFVSKEERFKPTNLALFKDGLNILHTLGLCVLNTKQIDDIEACKHLILQGGNFYSSNTTAKYASWVESWYYKYKAINQRTLPGIFEKEIGYAHIHALYESNPFKKEADLNRFLELLDYR